MSMSSKVKSWLLLAVIFVIGIVTGSALTIGLASHFMRPHGAQEMKNHWMMFLTQRLTLTADEQAKIQPILSEATNNIQALHRDEVDRGSQIIKAANDQIAQVLTPDQKVELQKMESEREKMFMGHMHPWGPPHDGPDGPPGGPDPMRHHWDDDAPPPPPPGAPPPPPGQTNPAQPPNPTPGA
jgi:Spy/CpxP family protein refolding chaperone